MNWMYFASIRWKGSITAWFFCIMLLTVSPKLLTDSRNLFMRYYYYLQIKGGVTKIAYFLLKYLGYFRYDIWEKVRNAGTYPSELNVELVPVYPVVFYLSCVWIIMSGNHKLTDSMNILLINFAQVYGSCSHWRTAICGFALVAALHDSFDWLFCAQAPIDESVTITMHMESVLNYVHSDVISL